jgi:hypothetical protein
MDQAGDGARELLRAADSEALRLLHSCRKAGTRLEILRRDTGQGRAGRIVQASPEAVTLALEPSPQPVEFETLALCFVSSVLEGRTLLFLSSVRGTRVGAGDVEELVLSTPEQVIYEDVRSAFRVPLDHPTGISVELMGEDASRAIDPLNLSISGMLFRDSSGPGLPVGREVELRIALDDEVFHVRGVVRRASGGHYGVFFPDSMRKGAIDPPEPLRRAVRRIELAWLARRKRAKR